MTNEQADIDELANEIITICDGLNSSVCVLSMLSVIEKIAFSEFSRDDFKRQTSSLLMDQSQRITDSIKTVSGLIN